MVDGDPGSAYLREAVGRIAAAGPSVGVHVLCLAETPDRLAAECGVLAILDGDVATTLRIEPNGPDRLTLDAVSPAWADRFARALAPLREGDAALPRQRTALPAAARLLDELDLALATPAKITARWDGGGGPTPAAGAATAVLGAGPDGRVVIDLASEGPHLIAGGAPGSGKTELLRSLAAALAASERPDRLSLVLVDGAGTERGEGLRVCTDLPHVSTYLSASDPLRMREFAQALGAELKRRDVLLDGGDFGGWHAQRRAAALVPRQGTAREAHEAQETADGRKPSVQGAVKTQTRTANPLPRLVVLVDDFDALVAPALGSTGRPAAGSVVRALEAVARDGERLGVHLVATTGRPERTAGTDADDAARLRIALRTEDPDAAALLVAVDDPAALDDSLPGRGYLRRPGGAVTPSRPAASAPASPAPPRCAPPSSPWNGTAWEIPHPPPRPRARQRPHRPRPARQRPAARGRIRGAEPAPPLL